MIGNNIKQRVFVDGEAKEYLKYLKFEVSEYKKSLRLFYGGGIGSEDKIEFVMRFKDRIVNLFSRACQ